MSGERHEKRVGLICGGAFDPCDGRSRYARRCENLKGEAAVSSDKAPGRHNLERSHEASIDAQLNWKNRRSDAATLSASASVGWAKARSVVPRDRGNISNGLKCRTLIASASTRDMSAGHCRSNLRSRLSQSSGLLRVSLVQSQRGHECRCAARRNAGALFMSEDGLRGLRPDRSRCAARLVAAYGQAAVVIGPLRRTVLGRKPEVICSFQALPLSTLSWRRH